ncbi:MAG: hypothetical protein WCS27_06265 [Victivallaceae bacterium]
MNTLAVNTAGGLSRLVPGVESQSFYDYFADAPLNRMHKRTNGLCFISQDNDFQRPYRIFNRSLTESPQFPYFRIMEKSNSLLTAWVSRNEHEPTEFNMIDLNNMSQENLAWLRAAGTINSITVSEDEKLMALAYYGDGWRVDIRRSQNFQLREVVNHASPLSGVFFHNDILFSLSDQLVASYPESRYESCAVCSVKKVLGWAKHPTAPYLALVETDCYRIIDLEKLCVIKTAEWTERIKWFYLLQKYSNRHHHIHVAESAVSFSKDGNHLLLGGCGQLAVFNWNDMLRPRCPQPEPENIITLPLEAAPDTGDKKRILDAHIVDILPLNRDKILCATAEGYLCQINTRTEEVFLLLKPGTGVRINSLQLCPKGKYLTMTGYYYAFDGNAYQLESAMLIWKMSRLLNKGHQLK